MIRLSNAQAKSISKDAIQNLIPEPSFVLWACMSEAIATSTAFPL